MGSDGGLEGDSVLTSCVLPAAGAQGTAGMLAAPCISPSISSSLSGVGVTGPLVGLAVVGDPTHGTNDEVSDRLPCSFGAHGWKFVGSNVPVGEGGLTGVIGLYSVRATLARGGVLVLCCVMVGYRPKAGCSCVCKTG